MNYWKSSESNPVKALILIVLIVVAGYFVYQGAHKNALENTAQVANNNPGGRATDMGKDKKGEGEVEGRCLDGGPASALSPSLGTPIAVTMVRTSTGAGGHMQVRGNFRITNPGPCPMKVTDLKFAINTDYITPSWPPMQNIKVIYGTSVAAGAGTFGTMLPFGTFDAVMCAASTSKCVLAFHDGAGVIIPAATTQTFRVVSDALNISMNPSGTPTSWFNVQFHGFNSVNPFSGAPFNWVYTTGTPIKAANIIVYP